MRLIYDNIIDDLNASTLTALTTATGYSVLDVQDERLSTAWKSSSATTQSILVELDTFPEYPDSTAGTTYLQDAWATVDGWTSRSGTITVSAPGNGKLKIEQTASESAWRARSAVIGTITGKTVRVWADYDATMTFGSYYNGSAYVDDIPINVVGTRCYCDFVLTTTENFLTFGFRYSASATRTAYIDIVYIGDGTYATKLPDVSGNGNDGTVYGCIPVDGIAGKALSFDGVNDYLSIILAKVWTTISVSCWIKRTISGATQYISYLARSGGGIFLLGLNTSNQIVGVWLDGASAGQTLTGPTIDTNWHHIAMTHSGTQVYLYVDGVSVASNLSTTLTATPSVLYAMGYDAGAGGSYYGGTITPSRIYNRALQPYEIEHLYNREHWSEEQFGLVMQLELDYRLGVNTAALLGHNIATGTTVKVQANNSNEWGAPEIDETMTVNDGAILTFLDDTYYYRYWRFSFTGQGDIEVGRAWLGEYLTVDPSSLLDFKVTKRRSDTNIYGIDRQKFSVPGVGWRRFELTFPETDKVMLESMQRFYSAVRVAHSFIFCNFDDIRDYQIVEPCYVSLQEPITYNHSHRMRFTYSLVMEEDR